MTPSSSRRVRLLWIGRCDAESFESAAERSAPSELSELLTKRLSKFPFLNHRETVLNILPTGLHGNCCAPAQSPAPCRFGGPTMPTQIVLSAQ